MVATIEWLERKYPEFAATYFGGKMPQVHFKLNRRTSAWALATANVQTNQDGSVTLSNYTIEVTTAYDIPEQIAEDNLLHEMIHVYDFFNFPEHFRKGRRYDAHGNDLFIPMMNSINGTGRHITVRVTQEEKQASKYTDAMRARLEKPFYICYARYKDPDNNKFFIATNTTLNNIVSNYKFDDDGRYIAYKHGLISIECYLISNIEVRESYSFTRGKWASGYPWTEQKWYRLLEYLGLEFKEATAFYRFGNQMNEKQSIHLTESQLRSFLKETIREVMAGMQPNSAEPVNGGDAVITTDINGNGMVRII